jgi:hypothetical protein
MFVLIRFLVLHSTHYAIVLGHQNMLAFGYIGDSENKVPVIAMLGRVISHLLLNSLSNECRIT